MATRTIFSKPTRFLSTRLLSVSQGRASDAPPSRFTPVHETLSPCGRTHDYTLPTVAPLFPTAKFVDTGFWIVEMKTSGLIFESGKALLDYCIKTLSAVVQSEEIAKEKIYFVSSGWNFLYFGAKINAKMIKSVQGLRDVESVCKDIHYDIRDMCPRAQFSPLNWNKRLHNMFSYYISSESKENSGPLLPSYKQNFICQGWPLRDIEEDSGHWLININQPDGGFSSFDEVVDCCTKLLAKVIPSKEEAKERMYAVWCIKPFGFAAEIDVQTADKLKCLPNVLKVLPDHAFDVKDKDLGTLVVYHSTSTYSGSRFRYYHPKKEYYSDMQLSCLKEVVGVGVSEEPKKEVVGVKSELNELNNIDPLLTEGGQMSDCKHWFVVLEKPGGEYASMQERINYYHQTLAAAIGGGVETENKIYRIKCDGNLFGFGAEVDVATSEKLKCMSGVLDVFPDYLFNKGCKAESAGQLAPVNWEHRLDDIFSYHYLSKRNQRWEFDHWLIVIKQPDCGFSNAQQAVDICIQILAKFIGSEEAKQRIYAVWAKTPFGFGVEIDVETLDKLKDVPEVLYILPDYVFDAKNKDRGIMVISPASIVDDRDFRIGYWVLDLDDEDEAS